MSEDRKPVDIPNRASIEGEKARLEYNKDYRRTQRKVVYALIVISAIAILMTTLLLPFLRIYGTSMTPTLENSDIVVCMNTSKFKTGDVIAFYYNNKILVKRVIGTGGDMVEVQEDGTVYLNGTALDEPYISEKSQGQCDIDMPYQVPEDTLFVIGDHRDTSVDSRSKTVGCVTEDQIVGKVMLRIWPLSKFGGV